MDNNSKYYELGFYLNAIHKIPNSDYHAHTWEVVLKLVDTNQKQFKYHKIEQSINEWLMSLEDKKLNELELFKNIIPVTENIAEILYFSINRIIRSIGYELRAISIVENGNRKYTVKKTKVEEKYFPFDDELTKEQAEINLVKHSTIVEEEQLMRNKGNNEKKEIVKNVKNKKKKGKKYIRLTKKGKTILLSFLFFTTFILIFTIMSKQGLIPSGIDVWGHLYKGEFMYNQLLEGNWFPKYSAEWYNGMEIFRYWGPITYYILAFFQSISLHKTPIEAYYLFVLMSFVVSIIPWYILGQDHEKSVLGFSLGLLWFFNPDNLRILFGEGNLPRVMITLLFPFLLIFIERYIEKKENKYLYFMTGIFFIMTLTHVMITALVGITSFLYLLARTNFFKSIKQNIKILVFEILGILLSGIWLVPALSGGIMKMDTNYDTVMKELTYHLSQSLNPFFRSFKGQPDSFYFGLFILMIAVIGSVYSKNKKMFGLVVIFFIGTTKLLVPILLKFPFSQLFWIVRFVPFAIAIFYMAFMKWELPGQKVKTLFLVFLVAESLITLQVLDLSKENFELKEEVEIAKSIADNRIALMDMSIKGADPSYLISAGVNGKKQVFGWAWQGASTKNNLVDLNESYIKGYYPFMFDRLIEIGADTVIVDESYILDENISDLLDAAKDKNYILHKTTENGWIFKLDVDYTYGVVDNYKNIAIGKDVEAITYLFPNFKIGDSYDLLDYSIEELSKYEKLFIANMPLDDISEIQEFLRELKSLETTEIFIDMSSFPSDDYQKQYKLFEVFREKLQLKDGYNGLKYKNTIYQPNNDFRSFDLWKTNSLLNLDNEIVTTDIDGVKHVLYGEKEGINFISGGLIYYLYDQKDEAVIDLFEEIFKESYGLNERVIRPLEISEIDDVITIKNKAFTKSEKIIIPIAYLDVYTENEANIDKLHDLVLSKDEITTLQIKYPMLKEGMIMSISVLIILFLMPIVTKQS